MSNSTNWLRYSAMSYLETLLEELVTEEEIVREDDSISVSDVHADTNIIDLSIDVNTGIRIRFKTSDEDLPDPLVVDTVYYAIRTSANHIKVAATAANAKAGTAIDLTDAGTGTHTLEQIQTKADEVTTDPTNSEWKDSDKVIFIRPGPDDHNFIGIPGNDVQLSASILIRCWGSTAETEDIVRSLERILANVRDKIAEGIVSESGFRYLDPPVQVEGCSVTDDPAYSTEQDISAATLELRISNHG